MKILKIRFQNIHSLKGEHEIDFASGILAEAGLFAITGPTGSGKSTLLDVITLALYNRIARVDRAVTNTILEDDGGIMTRNMASCYAEVDYAVNGKAYRSHWSIERNRNNNLNNRKQELVDVATGTILESGTKTPDKNQEIIRLSYEQFVKAMVLSQGEFSKLLQAPRNERNKLLEDITGAKSYRSIGRAVFQRYAEVKRNVGLKEAGLQTISLLSKEEIKNKQTELKALHIDKPKVQKAYERQLERIEIRKQLVAVQKIQKDLAEEADDFQESSTAFETDKVVLDKHEQLAKYGDTLRNYEELQKNYRNVEQEQKGIQKAKEEEELRLTSHLKTIAGLIGDSVTQEDANTKLETFRSKISKLQAKELAKRDEAQLYQNQVKGFVHKLQELDYDLEPPQTPSQFEKEVRGLEGSLNETIASSGLVSLRELEIKLESLRDLQEHASELLKKKSEFLKVEKLLTDAKGKLKTEQEKEKENAVKLLRLTKEVTGQESEVASLQKTLKHQRKHQSLEAHRLQLRNEEPCPLCGALDHPYTTKELHFDANEELLRNKESLLRKSQELMIILEENKKFRVGELLRIQREIDQRTDEKIALTTEVNEVLQLLKWPPKEDLIVLQSQRNGLIQHIQKLVGSKRAFTANDVLREIKMPQQAWQKTLIEYEYCKAERSKLYSGANMDAESNRMSTGIARSIASKKHLEKQLGTVKEQLKNIKQKGLEHRKHLSTILIQEKIEGLKQLRLAILPEETAKKYRDRKNELALWKAKLTEKQTANTDAITALTEKDGTEHSFEQLSTFFTESKEKWDNLSVLLGKITQLLEDDQNTRKKFKNEQIELNKLKKDQLLWKTMNDLIGDSYGNKFSNFVQDLTLEQLIGYANKRLSEFTDRYVLDIPTADEAEKSDTLKIFDTYMGNARRSVNTLSGGEIFLVSLAMAFALSDIASRNVKIESLFIDEGFGTLDPETLDQAITVLEKMQNEGDRSVGIISHVGALKERITTQVQLEKSSLGHSQIRVVQ
ncbi:MAG: exonuclease SbcC [Maribacter sp.]|jgi:exonuclease SbcC